MKSLKALIPAIALGLLAACSDNTQSDVTQSDGPNASHAEQAAVERVVNLYSTRHYDSDRELYRIFEEKTGIRVRAREAGSSALLETMKAEGATSPADVVLATDAGTLWRFQDENLLQPFTTDRLSAGVPAQYREPSGYWYGLSKRARVIVFDTQKHQASDFTDYSDLASPKYKGEVCMRSSSNIYNLSLMGELIERWGNPAAATWAESIVGNFARQPTGGDTTQIESIAAGECSVALINHYYWARLATASSADRRALTEATALVFPSGEHGTHVNITGGAIAANAPNKAEAIAFLEFLLSPEGQSMLISETKEFPISDSVQPPAPLGGFPEFRASAIALTHFGENQRQAQINYDKAGWN